MFTRCNIGGSGVSNFRVEKLTNVNSTTGTAISIDFEPKFILVECEATFSGSKIRGWQLLELWYTYATRKEIGYWNNQGNTGSGFITYSNGVVKVKTYSSNWSTNTTTVYIVG